MDTRNHAGALRRLCGAAVAGVVALVAPRAEASPEDLFGYGARTSAMGATGAAHAEGSETAFHNPALASRVRANALTLGWQDAVFSLPVDAQAARGVILGGAIPVPLRGIMHDRVGLSFGLYMPSDVIVRGRVLYPEKVQYPLLADRAQSVTLRAGVGVDVGWGFRAGVGVAALAELSGRVVAEAAGTRVEDSLVATYAPSFGLTWERGAFRIGAVYRGRLDARFDVTVDGSHLTTLPIPVFDIAGLAQYDPAQFVVEAVRTDVGPYSERIVSVQIAYKRWSDFPGLLTPTVVCTDGTTNCGLQPPKVDWRDTFVVRAGVEQRLDALGLGFMRVRAGGWVETSALPDRLPAGVAYRDGTRVVGTFGLGVKQSAFDIDAFAQEHWVLGEGRLTVFGIAGTVRF